MIYGDDDINDGVHKDSGNDDDDDDDNEDDDFDEFIKVMVITNGG